jgi:hypothetical protein
MKKINKTKFFAVLAIWAVAVAVGTLFLKQRLEIPSESLASPLISIVVTGIGVMGGITVLKGLVMRGKCQWLLEKTE